ncbi:MAG TPA: hypothetical protein VFL15_05285 [Gammaproteobacteria bacterium]|nr:hypothetical protein [Gammaproteobacteria bacterium]
MHATTEQLTALRDGEPVAAEVQSHVCDCRECSSALDALAELRRQLGTLPEFALPEQAFEKIRQRMAQGERTLRKRNNWLRAASVAMVASVVVAVTLAMFPQAARPPVGIASAGTAPSESVPQLITQSRYLENAVLSLNSDADHLMISAGTAATVAALEDRIALIDYEINKASVDPRQQSRLSQLWQQRVSLLQSLAAVRYAQVASSNI